MESARTAAEEEAGEVSRGSEVIRWFDQLGRGDVPIAGGKGANLGEMVRAGIRVPPGFVITASAFDRYRDPPWPTRR
jgi:phosphoenolpyruvate synthase/pyruvate phosphate dikinase